MVTLLQSLESGHSVKSLVSHCHDACFLGPCTPCFLTPLPVFLPSWALCLRTGSSQRITHQRRDPFQRAALTQIFQKGNPTPSVSPSSPSGRKEKKRNREIWRCQSLITSTDSARNTGKLILQGEDPGPCGRWQRSAICLELFSISPRPAHFHVSFLQRKDRLSCGGFRRGLWILSLETEC